LTSEAEQFLEKAWRCLANAEAILRIGLGDEAGRGAYLGAFHAARAFIYEPAMRRRHIEAYEVSSFC
jgi:uncharacterized protein (UPF0332 family)